MKREATGFCYDFSDHWSPWSWMNSWQMAVLLEETGVMVVSETWEDCMGHQTSLKYNSETTDPLCDREIVNRQELRKWEVLNFQYAGIIPDGKHRYPFLQSHRHQAKLWFCSERNQWNFFLYLNTTSKCRVCSFALGIQHLLHPLLPIFFYSLSSLYLNDLYLFSFFPLLDILIPFYKS